MKRGRGREGDKLKKGRKEGRGIKGDKLKKGRKGEGEENEWNIYRLEREKVKWKELKEGNEREKEERKKEGGKEIGMNCRRKGEETE